MQLQAVITNMQTRLHIFVLLAVMQVSILKTSCKSYKTTRQKENRSFISTKPEKNFIAGFSWLAGFLPDFKSLLQTEEEGKVFCILPTNHGKPLNWAEKQWVSGTQEVVLGFPHWGLAMLCSFSLSHKFFLLYSHSWVPETSLQAVATDVATDDTKQSKIMSTLSLPPLDFLRADTFQEGCNLTVNNDSVSKTEKQADALQLLAANLIPPTVFFKLKNLLLQTSKRDSFWINTCYSPRCHWRLWWYSSPLHTVVWFPSARSCTKSTTS